MTMIAIRHLAPLKKAAFLLVLAALAGCEKKQEEVFTPRGGDPEYVRSLEKSIARQSRAQSALAKISAQMKSLEDRARAALPPGATAEQIKAELDGNPSRYAGWKDLSEAFAKVSARVEKERADAQAIVRGRIEREAADRRRLAANGGAAKPAAR